MMEDLTLNLATLDDDYERLYGSRWDPSATPIPFVQNPPVKSALVDAEKEGREAYAPYDEKGATLLDFSRVGYHGGEREIPVVKEVLRLSVEGLADHTTLIQEAIDRVAALPREERGAIVLEAGVYVVSAPLTVNASGIVLRGEGEGRNGTVLYDVLGTVHTTLQLSAWHHRRREEGAPEESEEPSSVITDAYVPVGQTRLHLSPEEISRYCVGDMVRVQYHTTEHWIHTMGMDRLNERCRQWECERYSPAYERVIVALGEDYVELDTALAVTLDAEYGTATLCHVGNRPYIEECGVESIRFVSHFSAEVMDDDQHGWGAVRLDGCRHCWVSSVSAEYYGYSTVMVGPGSRWNTVQFSSYLRPVSRVTGGRRYSFCINGGQYTLIKNCYSHDSRHDYVVQSLVPGPNVFYGCVSDESNSVSEPHHRWSSGTLYDNVYQTGRNRLGYFEVVNRGNSGSGHGWAGATTMFWNCLSPAIAVGKPITEQNFAIGAHGLYRYSKTTAVRWTLRSFVAPEVMPDDYPPMVLYPESPMFGNAYIEATQAPVLPYSLYAFQKERRLRSAVSEALPPPVLQAPVCEAHLSAETVSVSGVCRLGVDSVTVYVDGVPHTAVIDEHTHEFFLNVPVSSGWHAICATQTAGKCESERTAMRYIKIMS